MKTLGNGSMKPFQLKQHLENSPLDKGHAFFKFKEANLKQARLDMTGTFQNQTAAIVKASYEIVYEIVKNKKGHMIGETKFADLHQDRQSPKTIRR